MCMSRLGIIYKVTNKINGKIYIGKTVKSLSRRRTEHHTGIENTDNVFKGFKGALQKYGKEQFVWEILEECPIEELNSREVHYIEDHKSYMKGVGYNLTKGGDGAPYGDLNPSKRPDVKEKLRLANTGYKHTEDTLKIMSEKSLEFYKNGMPVEQRVKISESLLKLNRHVPAGKDSPMAKGCTLVDPDGIVHEVMGIRLFAQENGLDNSAVSKLINGKLKTHKGWRLYEEQ